MPQCCRQDFLHPTEATRVCELSRGFLSGGTSQSPEVLSLLPLSAIPRLFSSSACGSVAEGLVSVFLSLEQGLPLHRLNFSFAAEFLSPNNQRGAAASLQWGCE